MPHLLRRLAALGALAALALPTAASAHNRPRDPHHGRVRLASFEFKGVYAGDGAVTVAGGNSRVRRGGFVGETVTFDLSQARLAVADVDGDGTRSAADLRAGDRVVVQARLPRETDADARATLAARKLVVRAGGGHRGRGSDDPAGDDRGRGSDDAAADDHGGDRGRGSDDTAADDHGRDDD